MRLLYMHQAMGSLGGAEANVFITATELKKRGVRVGLLTRQATGKGVEAWKELFGDEIYYQDQDSRDQILESFSPDVLYLHKWDHLQSLGEWVDGDVPVVRMVHDHESYCLRGYKYHPISRKICHKPAGLHCIAPCLAVLKVNRGNRIPVQFVSYLDKIREIELCRKMQAQFVVTEYMREELVNNRFSSERIHLFPPVPREVAPLESTFSDRNLIVYAGQIIRGKGVDVLLWSLFKMRKSFECIILGDGHHLEYCKTLSQKLGLTDLVHFKGFVPQEELRRYYQEASAVVVPSVWPEPIATIGLEVMRYGLPVVGFNSGGIGDWLKDGENGYLVPWMDTDKFALSLDKLLGDKALARRMGEAGRVRVARDYGFDDYIQRLHQTLEQLGKREFSLESV